MQQTKLGLIPPDGILGLSEAGTNRDSSLVANKPASRIDALDRAMVIFRHPADAVSGWLRDKYRRVDLIVSRWGSWGSAVVGVRLFKRSFRPFLSLLLSREEQLTTTSSRAGPHSRGRTAVDRFDAV